MFTYAYVYFDITLVLRVPLNNWRKLKKNKKNVIMVDSFTLL